MALSLTALLDCLHTHFPLLLNSLGSPVAWKSIKQILFQLFNFVMAARGGGGGGIAWSLTEYIASLPNGRGLPQVLFTRTRSTECNSSFSNDCSGRAATGGVAMFVVGKVEKQVEG